MKTKFFTLVLTLVMVFTFAACGGGTSETNAPADTGNTTTTPTPSTDTADTPQLSNDPSIPTVSVGEPYKFDGYDYIILDVKDGKALLLGNYEEIGDKEYHSAGGNITWENSEIRKYLNGEYYNYFTDEAKARIVETKIENKDNPWYGTDGGNDTTDKLFLLSVEEVIKYFGDSGQYVNQPNGALWIDDEFNSERVLEKSYGTLDWWLRSPGSMGDYAAYIVDNGTVHIQGYPVDFNDNGVFSFSVRAAMWVTLTDEDPIFAVTPPQTLAPLVTTTQATTTAPPADTTTAPPATNAPADTTTAPPANTTTTTTPAPAAKPTLTIDKTSYAAGDTIKATVNNIPELAYLAIHFVDRDFQVKEIIIRNNGTHEFSGSNLPQHNGKSYGGNFEMQLIIFNDAIPNYEVVASVKFTISGADYDSVLSDAMGHAG